MQEIIDDGWMDGWTAGWTDRQTGSEMSFYVNRFNAGGLGDAN